MATLARTCFHCNQTGHWAAQCPEKVCNFCGHHGHWASKCEMKARLEVPVPVEREQVSRTRSRAAVMSLADIMFNCQLNKGFSKKMEEQVVALMKSVCPRGIDEGRIAEYVFEENREAFMLCDDGHMQVLGFIIKKYLSADNEVLKTFLREEALPDDIIKGVFGLIVVRKANGTMCFRKAGWDI